MQLTYSILVGFHLQSSSSFVEFRIYLALIQVFDVFLFEVTFRVDISITDQCVSSNSIQGAAEKSNPIPYVVDIQTTKLNSYKKIYTAILQSYLHIIIIAKLYYIVTSFD